MLQLMRNPRFIKGAMWVVIVAFVGWLGLELGWQRGGPTGANPEVGKVEGEPIYWLPYRREISDVRDFHRRQTDEVVDEFDLDEQVWQQSVQYILLQKAIERMNIVVTADEVAEAMVANPPRGFEQIPEFQREDGSFDRELYRDFLATMTQGRWYQITGMTLSDYESQMKFNLQAQKLQRAIQQGAWVTNAELKLAHRDENERIRARVIPTPISLIDDEDIEITDDDVRRYYQANLSDFMEPARARLDYVIIDRRPSPQDSAMYRNQAWDIYSRLADGEDFESAARMYSEDEGSARDGGSLGTFSRGQMVPAFEEAAFSGRAGQILEPVHTQFGWHIIKVERRVTTPADSVEARHILIRDTEPGFDTLDSLQAIAENLSAAGPRFTEVARNAGLTPETTDWFTRDVSYPIPRMAEPLRRLVRWAFVADPESIASPHTTDNAIIVARLAARRTAGPRDLSEVRPQIEARLRLDKKVRLATELMRPVAERLAQGQTMDQAVQGTELSVVDVGPFTRGQYLPEVEAGSHDAFSGAAFALRNPGDMSGLVVAPERGAYIITLAERTYDDASFESEKDQIRSRLARRHQQSLFADWERFYRKNAEIKDYRDEFYNYQ